MLKFVNAGFYARRWVETPYLTPSANLDQLHVLDERSSAVIYLQKKMCCLVILMTGNKYV